MKFTHFAQGKEEKLASFIPLLHLSNIQKIYLRQKDHFDEIHITLDMHEDEIKEQIFQALPAEQLETSLGCLQTTPVERVRVGSTRYTRAWHAPGLDFITVRMEHGKTDGDHLELRITGLEMDEQEIAPEPGCVASQSSAGSP